MDSQTPTFFSLLLQFLPLGLLGYLCGSVPFGMVFARVFCGIDPRTAGSHNVGATNVARLCGKKWGAATLLCDASKGLIPILIAAGVGPYVGQTALAAGALGLGAILGHMFSFLLRFRGGKGVATTVGVFLAMHPLALLLAGATCLVIIWRTGFVSAGSLVLVTLLPILLVLFGQPTSAGFAIAIGALVVFAHRENIKRLLTGTEKTWSPAAPKNAQAELEPRDKP